MVVRGGTRGRKLGTGVKSLAFDGNQWCWPRGGHRVMIVTPRYGEVAVLGFRSGVGERAEKLAAVNFEQLPMAKRGHALHTSWTLCGKSRWAAGMEWRLRLAGADAGDAGDRDKAYSTCGKQAQHFSNRHPQPVTGTSTLSRHPQPVTGTCTLKRHHQPVFRNPRSAAANPLSCKRSPHPATATI